MFIDGVLRRNAMASGLTRCSGLGVGSSIAAIASVAEAPTNVMASA